MPDSELSVNGAGGACRVSCRYARRGGGSAVSGCQRPRSEHWKGSCCQGAVHNCWSGMTQTTTIVSSHTGHNSSTHDSSYVMLCIESPCVPKPRLLNNPHACLNFKPGAPGPQTLTLTHSWMWSTHTLVTPRDSVHGRWPHSHTGPAACARR